MSSPTIEQDAAFHARVETTLTMECQGRARAALAEDFSLRTIAAHTRNSFHSLIGDLWLAGIVDERFDKSALGREHAPLLPLFNEQIPVPNRHTVLAWSFICETGYSHFGYVTAPRFILPQSIHHHLYTEQAGLFDQTLKPSPRLPVMRSLGMHVGEEMKRNLNRRTEFYGGDVFASAPMYGIFASKANAIQRNAWHHDARLETVDQLRHGINVLRLAAMSEVLTPIFAPTAAAAVVAQMGVTIQGLTRHGLYVKPPVKTSEAAATWLEDGAAIRSSRSRSSFSMTHVPLGTPFLWLCFNEQSAIQKWIDAYVEHRPYALSQMADPIDPASLCPVTNPTWQTQLSEHGLIQLAATKKEETPKTAKSGSRASRLEFVASSMIDFEF